MYWSNIGKRMEKHFPTIRTTTKKRARPNNDIDNGELDVKKRMWSCWKEI